MAPCLATTRARGTRVTGLNTLGRPRHELASLLIIGGLPAGRFQPAVGHDGKAVASAAQGSSNSDGDEQAPLTTTGTNRASNAARRA